MSKTKIIAQAKVEKALELIEQAQGLLSAACTELCCLKYAADQWTMVGDQYDAVKALWHRVNETVPRSKVDLDNYFLTPENRKKLGLD